eukprot:SAG11_NODE_1177_length_5600_cov_2.043447_1_plen_182_part_00
MRVVIIGAGALGGQFAANLASAPHAHEHELHIVDTWREHVEAINTHGLRVGGVFGNKVVRIRACVCMLTAGPLLSVHWWVSRAQGCSMHVGAWRCRPSWWELSMRRSFTWTVMRPKRQHRRRTWPSCLNSWADLHGSVRTALGTWPSFRCCHSCLQSFLVCTRQSLCLQLFFVFNRQNFRL